MFLLRDLLLHRLSTQSFKNMNKRLIGINIIILLAIFFALEVVSRYAVNLKRFKFKKSSLIYTVRKISIKIKNPMNYLINTKGYLFFAKMDQRMLILPTYLTLKYTNQTQCIGSDINLIR